MFDKNSWQLEDISFVLNEYSELLRWGYKDETVLHYGCGSGFITGKFLMPHLPENVQVVGVEDDHNLVEFAKKYHKHDKVQYRKLMEIKDCLFDHILSFYYFNESIDELKLFHKLNQHLSHNGDVIMILLNEHSVRSILEKLQEDQRYQGKFNKSDIKSMNFTAGTLLEAMENANFSNTISKCYDRYHLFPSKSVLRKFIKSNLGNINMTDEEFNGFINDFVEYLNQQEDIKRIGRNRNGYAMPYKLTFVYGKKKQTNK